MPVKWDAPKDTFMLLFLFSEDGISKERCEAIIAAWREYPRPSSTIGPASTDTPIPLAIDKFGAKPTVRAIKEHLIKLKTQQSKELGISPKAGGKTKASNRVNVGGSEEGSDAEAGAPLTPPASNRKKTTKPKPPARKRNASLTTSDDEDDPILIDTPTKKRVKTEENADADGDQLMRSVPQSSRKSLPRESKSTEKRFQLSGTEESSTDEESENDQVSGGEYKPEVI